MKSFLRSHALGQAGDRQRRGVRAEQRVGGDDLLDLGEHVVLERDLLEHGLDDEVAALEVGVVRGRRDAGQDLVGLVLRHLAAADGLVEQLLRVALAALGRLDRDVLEHDRHAVAGGDVGDAGAHHAGAEHGHLGRQPLLVAVGTRRAAVDRVQVEPERLDHVLRDLARGQVDEVAALDRSARCRSRRVAPSTAAHMMWCGAGIGAPLSCFFRLPGKAGSMLGELRVGRGAAGHAVALGVPGLHRLRVGLDPLAGLGQHLLRRGGDLVDRGPSSTGLGRLVAVALQQHLHQAVGHAEQADDAGDAAGAGQQAEGDLGQAELRLRVVQRDAPVAGERDLQAAAERRAVERGDGRLAQLLEAAEVGLDARDAARRTRPCSRR